MSNHRYLEITSTYRNRKQWPLPGEFEVLISQTGRKGQFDALDAVSTASSKKTWISNRFIADTGGATITVTVDALVGIGASGDQTVVIVTAPAGDLQTLENYYQAAIAMFGTLTNRVIGYKYLGSDRAELIFNNSFSTALVPGNMITITDPTDLTPTTSPYFFVPAGLFGSNAYNNDILYNVTQNESRPISGYDFFTHLLSVDTSGSAVSTSSAGPVTSWTTTDTYTIRETPILSCGTLTGDIANNPSTHNSFILPAVNSFPNLTGSFLEIENTLVGTDSNGILAVGGTTSVTLAAAANADDGFFVGCTIRMTTGAAIGQESLITAYNGTTRVVTLSPGFSVAAGADTYYITCPLQARQIVKYVDNRGAVVGSGLLTSVDLPAPASSVNGDYNNLYIRITSGLAAGDVRLIQTYTVTTTAGVTTRRATPYVPFSAAVVAGDDYEITSGLVAPPFSGSIAVNNFCLLQFSYDNAVPFDYTGSTVSQQEDVCYELELLNLILPNQTLNVGEGSRITFYPYLYVEFTNTSSPSAGMKGTIYSNNPNSTRMLFRCAVDDVPNPVLSTFLKIDGDGMVQTVKFKPNDNLKFAVHLPNGEIYNTVVPETCSPNRPNPLIQISALFSMKRL